GENVEADRDRDPLRISVAELADSALQPYQLREQEIDPDDEQHHDDQRLDDATPGEETDLVGRGLFVDVPPVDTGGELLFLRLLIEGSGLAHLLLRRHATQRVTSVTSAGIIPVVA